MFPSQIIDQLQQFRRLLISLLNSVDDLLGLPRTIPTQTERRREAKRMGEM